MVGLAVSLLVRLVRMPDSLVEIGKKYSVQVEVIDSPYSWTGRGYTIKADTPQATDLEKYAWLFASEWNRYPISAIKSAKLKRIIIGANISLNGQIRAAVPAFEANTMYYDTTLGNYSAPYQRMVVHHEFFHMIDQVEGILRKDSEWAALNAPEFHYGSGGEKVRNLGAGVLTDKLPGVLTVYAMSGIEEDKAELFGHLLVDRDYVEGRMKADSVIAAKVGLLKGRLGKWDAAINDEFWNSKAGQ